jgi:hypothetical protein
MLAYITVVVGGTLNPVSTFMDPDSVGSAATDTIIAVAAAFLDLLAEFQKTKWKC